MIKENYTLKGSLINPEHLLLKGVICKNWPPVKRILKTYLLLPALAISLLAHLAVQLVAQTGSSEHQGSECVYTTRIH